MKLTTAIFVSAGLWATSVVCANAATIRAGEWEVTVKMGAAGPTPMVRKICYPADVPVSAQYLANAMGRMRADCAKPDTQVSGNVMMLAIVCKFQQMTMTTKSTTTFDGDAYHTDTQTHTDNPINGMPADMAMTQDAKWVGPCQPGDRQAPDYSK
jgi:hypothetical protein